MAQIGRFYTEAIDRGSCDETLNQRVQGSNPCAPTIHTRDSRDFPDDGNSAETAAFPVRRMSLPSQLRAECASPSIVSAGRQWFAVWLLRSSLATAENAQLERRTLAAAERAPKTKGQCSRSERRSLTAQRKLTFVLPRLSEMTNSA